MEPTNIVTTPKMWYPGDARVEPFMVPVNDELHRHNLPRDVRVSVYNRAYEAVEAAINKYAITREEIEAPLRAEIERLREAASEMAEVVALLPAENGQILGLLPILCRLRAALAPSASEARKPSKREELLEAHLSACIDQMDQVAKMFRDDEDFMRALNEAREILYPSKETSNGPRT